MTYPFILSEWGLGEGSFSPGVDGELSSYTCTCSCLRDSSIQVPRRDLYVFWGISRIRHYRLGNNQTSTNQAICIYTQDSFRRQLWKPARIWWAYLQICGNLSFPGKEEKRELLKASFYNVFTLRYFSKVWQNCDIALFTYVQKGENRLSNCTLLSNILTNK